MKMIRLGKNGTSALMLGGICSFSYFVVYIVRNLLSAVIPQMIESGVFTTEEIGTLSSVFFFVYAIGQLFNGLLGDRLKASIMIISGLILAGVSNLAFTFFASSPSLSLVFYAAVGFFLSMLFAPMTRLIAESLPPKYATRCALSLSIAAYFASPIAGILAACLIWRMVFHTGSALLVFAGILCLISFYFLKRKSIISERKKEKKEKTGGGVRALFRRRIIVFTLVSLLTGIIRTSVVFWMPAFFSQKLGFSAEAAALLFTVSTTVIVFNSFWAVWCYKKLKQNIDLTLFLSFGSAAVSFVLLYFVKSPALGVLFMILAVFAASSAASVLWSIYCPSLADTGLVSSATGFLDFVSYMAAAVSSAIFGNAVGSIGWEALILSWAGLMLLGTGIFIPVKKKTE